MYRRKNKIYIVYIVVLLSFISVGYAILSQSLNINGQTQISKVTWDVYFDNIEEVEGSVEASNKAAITNKNTIDFSVLLDKPGDFYAFNVNIVNNGSIDAMIDSIQKTPELTEAQKKYLDYTITYENGIPISTNQLVEKNSFVRLFVKIEFKSDIDAADLPQNSEELDLSFNLNYVQSDENNNTVLNNGMVNETLKITGIGTNLGDEICIKNECFYVLYSNEETVTMISKYNLQVGFYEDENGELVQFENPTGLQDPLTLYNHEEEPKKYAVIPFSETNYWWDYENQITKQEYPFEIQLPSDELEINMAYIYSEDSLSYNHIEKYKEYLESQGFNVKNARLPSFLDIMEIENQIGSANDFLQEKFLTTSYWLGTTYQNIQYVSTLVIAIQQDGIEICEFNKIVAGVRPIIVISKDELY